MNNRAVTASTAVYGVAGDPISHSMSPMLHNAVFRALGVDAISVAFLAGVDDAASVVDVVRRLGVGGLSVTMPLKEAVVLLCDERTETVERVGAANCLMRRHDGSVLAASTDGEGVTGAIARRGDVEVAGQRCAVLGAGGAARAAIDALCEAGAREVIVVARDPLAAAVAASVGQAARPGTSDEARDAAVVVQATPIGMARTRSEHAPALLDGGALGVGQLAVELVYHPSVTPWLAQAASAGASPVSGADVLAHQAAAALSLWLGVDVPIGPLLEVVAQL